MKIPIQFPSEADVIAEEAARFRELTNRARIHYIRGLLEAGELMLRNSPRSSFLKEYAAEEARASRRAVQEFLTRHAHGT